MREFVYCLEKVIYGCSLSGCHGYELTFVQTYILTLALITVHYIYVRMAAAIAERLALKTVIR